MNVVYTIGYEGTDIDRFVETLKVVGVRVLADVRAVAISRKKGFSKNALRDRLEAEGIAYVHFKELGDPKPGREAARAGNYKQFRKIFNSHLSQPETQIALKVLLEVSTEKPTCLMCFEREPKFCHRSILSNSISMQRLEVFDLYGDSPERYVRHAQKIPRHDNRESTTTAQ